MKLIYNISMYGVLPLFYIVWLLQSYKMGQIEIPLTALTLLLSGAIGYYVRDIKQNSRRKRLK